MNYFYSTLVVVVLMAVGRYFVDGTFAKNVRVQWPRARSGAYVVPVGRQTAKTHTKRSRNNQDFYDFVSDGDKREHLPGSDNYFEFLTGDKKADTGAGNDLGYWRFINGEDMPRKRMQRVAVNDKSRRKKRSVDGRRGGSTDSVASPRLDEHTNERRSAKDGQTGPRMTYDEFLSEFAKRNDKQDLSWDDFVVGKKDGQQRSARMDFDNFLLGEKKNVQSDHGMVDHDEFVLGKRPDMVDHDEFVLGKRPEMVDHDEFVLGKRPDMVSHDDFVLGKRPEIVDHDEFVLGKRP